MKLKIIISAVVVIILVIVAFSFRSQNLSQTVIDNDGAETVPTAGEDFKPASGIVFTVDYGIYFMDENGGNVRRLSPEGEQNDGHPAVSFDGTKIAFTNTDEGWSSIWVMNIDGSGRTMLVKGNNAHAYTPTWSPDGKKIYYTKQTQLKGNTLIYSISTDGTGGETRISPPYEGKYDIGELSPKVSPDGTRIAFNTERPFYVTSPQGKSVKISGNFAIMNIDGSGLVPLETVGLKDLLGDPDFDTFETWYTWLTVKITQGVGWSPDGSKLTFSAYPPSSKKFHAYPPDNSPRLPQIYVTNSDGTGTTQLTSDVIASSYGPSWSPDGTKIIFWKEYPDRGGNKIYVMNSDGSSQKELNIQKINSDPDFTSFAAEWPSFFKRSK